MKNVVTARFWIGYIKRIRKPVRVAVMVMYDFA